MHVTKSLGLAMSIALVGTSLGCAPSLPNANVSAPAPIPQAQSITEGSVHPDQLLESDRQIMVDGQAMTFEQIRKQLPSRISEADAAKMLVKIDPAKVVESNDKEVQQRVVRGFGRGWGRGIYGRGVYGRGIYGRGIYGRGLYGGYGYGGLYGGYGGLYGGYGGYGGLCNYGAYSYLGYGGYYWPYYSYAGYYYPYSYGYGGLSYYPYMYGYGGGYYPFSYCY